MSFAIVSSGIFFLKKSTQFWPGFLPSKLFILISRVHMVHNCVFQHAAIKWLHVGTCGHPGTVASVQRWPPCAAPTTLPPSASLPLFHWPPHAHCHLPQLSLLLAHAPPPASHASLCPITSAPHHHAILPCRPPFACHRMSFLPFLLVPVPLATRSASFHPT